MENEPLCPGCRHQLDVISAAGRADDLFLCSRCFHSWFAFELQHTGNPRSEAEGDDADTPDAFH